MGLKPPQILRLVSWNCAMGFERKVEHLLRLEPSVAVVSECADLSLPRMAAARSLGVSRVRKGGGGPRDKGIAVYTFGAYRIDAAAENLEEHVMRVRIDGPIAFELVAMWPIGRAAGLRGYVERLHRALDRLASRPSELPLVFAGDWNSHSQFDAEHPPTRNHTALVERLHRLGAVSAWHSTHAEASDRATPTYFHRWKAEDPFHLDYVFVPKTWRVMTADVGRHEEWLSLSDHMPITVDVEVSPARCRPAPEESLEAADRG